MLGDTGNQGWLHVDACLSDVLSPAPMIFQILSKLFHSLGITSLCDKQNAPGIGISGQAQVAVPLGARGLVNGQCSHVRAVDQATSHLHLLLAHRQYLMGRLAHNAGHASKRHLACQHKDEGLKQQRQAVKASCKVRLDQAYRAIGQFHTRRAYLQMALVLEEVQIPLALGHGVMHRMQTFMARDRKAASP